MCHKLIEKDVRLVPKRLELPLFMLSRIHIRQNNLQSLRQLIARKSLDYTKRCKKENSIESKNRKSIKHMLGRDHVPSQPCPQKRILYLPRLSNSVMPWHLPPNLYTAETTKRIGAPPDCEAETRLKRKREHEQLWMLKKSPKIVKTSSWKFYEKNNNWQYCNRYKGIFLSNPRNRRASTRNMVINVKDCYRDSEEPGPNHYFPKNEFMEKTAHPIVELKEKPNPHIFLPGTSVPVKELSIYPKHGSFAPGPGRYETRYRDSCPCSRQHIYMPGLQLMIENEKRKKFRHLPYQKINARKYCCPDWRQVVGHGFRYLFRQSRIKPGSNLPEVQKTPHKSPNLNLETFPHARYIEMINDPNRIALTKRKPNFNQLSSRIAEKRLGRRSDKNIAFNSGEERFKDILKAPTLTRSQLKAIKLRLPAERRLSNRPVMRVQPDQIKSRLYENRKSKNVGHDVVFRKQLFKFLPLPSPKILVSADDIKPRTWKPLHNYDLDPTNYFKDAEKAKEVRKLLFPDGQLTQRIAGDKWRQ